MNSRAFVKLRIDSSAHSAQEIEKLIGMAAERSWSFGQSRSFGKIKHRSNGWEVHSGLPPEDDLDAHLDALLSKVEGVSENISHIPEEFEAILSCAVYSDYNPELFFTSGRIARIAALKVSFDIDVYAIDE